jgi:glycosyltransferase involved in cell wall biosynthesis
VLSRYLASRGHKVVLLAPTAPKKEDLEYLNSIPVLVFPSIFLPRIRYTIPFFLKQLMILRQVNRREGIDIIHIWTYFYPTAWVPFLYGKVRHIPVVVTTDSLPGISWHYGSRFVDIVAKVYSKSIGKLILQGCDRVLLLNSRVLMNTRKMGISEENISVIPNGVEPAYPAEGTTVSEIRRNLGITANEKMVLNVSRLVPVKGIDTLIKITEGLLNDGFKVKTVVAGDGPYRKEYEEKARSLGENIIFCGFRRDIPELMSACDVFVLPSLSEGLPNVLLEAAACGKPMVASNVGGVPDIITHGKTGFLASPKDIKTFIHYIEMILSDSNLAEMGREAREHVRENFDWGNIVNTLEETYALLLKSR